MVTLERQSNELRMSCVGEYTRKSSNLAHLLHTAYKQISVLGRCWSYEAWKRQGHWPWRAYNLVAKTSMQKTNWQYILDCSLRQKNQQNTEEDCRLSYQGRLLQGGSTWIKLKEQVGFAQAKKKFGSEHFRTKKLAKTQKQEWVDYVLGKITVPIQNQIHDQKPK